MIEPERKPVALPDGSVSTLEWSADAPLLHFSHANGFNAQTYRGLLGPLAGRFRIVASDMRGHGFSTLPAIPGMQEGWRIFGSDLAAVLDALDRKPVVLAGHSMGAIASLMVASRFPDRVRGIVLVEPVLVPRFSRIFQRLIRMMGVTPPPGTDLATMAEKRRSVFPSFEMALSAYRGRGAFKTWQDDTLADYLRGGLIPTGNGTEMQLACAPQWEAASFRNAPSGSATIARGVRCPMTVIYAGNGTAREHQVQIVKRLVPATRLVQVPGTTHFLPMERPDIVREELARIAN